MSKKRKKPKGLDESLIKYYLKVGGSAGGQYIPLTRALMQDTDFHSLSPMTRFFFLCLASEANGEDTATLSHKKAKDVYGISPGSYDNAKKDLIEKKWIEVVEGLSRLETNQFRFLYRFPKLNAEVQEKEDDSNRLWEYCKNAQAKRSDRPDLPAGSKENGQCGEK